LARIPDPRGRRGLRHPLAAMRHSHRLARRPKGLAWPHGAAALANRRATGRTSRLARFGPGMSARTHGPLQGLHHGRNPMRHPPVASDRLPRNRRRPPRFLLPPPKTPPIPRHNEKPIGPDQLPLITICDRRPFARRRPTGRVACPVRPARPSHLTMARSLPYARNLRGGRA